jgi:hypothetical protein
VAIEVKCDGMHVCALATLALFYAAKGFFFVFQFAERRSACFMTFYDGMSIIRRASTALT